MKFFSRVKFVQRLIPGNCFMLLIFLISFSLLYLSCENPANNDSKSAPVLVSIDITALPFKTVYYVGDSLDLTGLEVTATFSDSSKAVLALGTMQISTFDSSTAGDKIITISYSGKAVTFTVTVNAGFVAVTSITGVPEMIVAGAPVTLTVTVLPYNATNKIIVWEVKNTGSTGAIITGAGNVLNATAEGNFTLVAIIANGLEQGVDYTCDFPVKVISEDEYVPVSDISSLPTVATAGIPLTLEGIIVPNNASSQTIVWGIQSAGTTGAEITNGNILTAAGSGNLIIVAMIPNGVSVGIPYIQTFNITVNSGFVAITNISGVGTTASVGMPHLLFGTILPGDATAADEAITWIVQDAGTTGAVITDGNSLIATSWGEATVIAMVSNGSAPGIPYVQSFTIKVNIIPVTGISVVPSSAVAGTPLTLTGTVAPDNATYKSIVWTVENAGTTGATITEGTLNVTDPGTVVVLASIVDGSALGTPYTQNFSITVTQPVLNISDVPTIAFAGVDINLTGTVEPDNASKKIIIWSVESQGTTGATISGSTLSTTSIGTVTVKATIADGLAPDTPYTQEFEITVNVVQVTNIIVVPTTAIVGTPFILSGTVVPGNATYKDIEWSIYNAGTTGAIINGDTVNTTGPGIVTIRGTIANGLAIGTSYIEDFNISVQQPEVFLISFSQIKDEAPSINGPTISRTGVGWPKEVTLNVDNPTQYSTIEWFVNGTNVIGSGASFVLNAANTAYNMIGQHFLSLEVVEDGVPYSQTIIFTVTQ